MFGLGIIKGTIIGMGVGVMAGLALKEVCKMKKKKDQISKIKVYEDMIIPEKFDYNNIKSLSNESREKFINIKPQTVGQAQRINGIRPSDISILLVYLKRPFHVKQIK